MKHLTFTLYVIKYKTIGKNSLKIPKEKLKVVNWRIDNTMAKRKRPKRTNNDLQNTKQKTKDRATWTPLKTGCELRCSSSTIGRSFFSIFTWNISEWVSISIRQINHMHTKYGPSYGIFYWDMVFHVSQNDLLELWNEWQKRPA